MLTFEAVSLLGQRVEHQTFLENDTFDQRYGEAINVFLFPVPIEFLVRYWRVFEPSKFVKIFVADSLFDADALLRIEFE